MVMQRGEIWWASLPEPAGSAPGYRRPIVILQADAFNRSGIPTVITASMTTNLRLADAPGNVVIPKGVSGLPSDSVVNVSQIVTVDRSRLSDRKRKLSASYMSAIDRGMRLVLDL